MKIKVFGATNSEDLERMVNDFCMDKAVQDIKYQSMYTNGGTATQYSVAKQGATGAAGADALTGTITLSNGNIFKNNTGSTVLTAHVWKGSVEQTITDAGVCGSLGSVKWYKVGSDTAIATAKSITVSAGDVTNTASYYFQLEG